MLRFPAALQAWNTPAFAAVLKDELAGQAAALPLQQATAHGSIALDGGIEVMFIGATADPASIRAHVGIFFSGIVAGCSCADDPTPVEPQPEYCELRLSIDRSTAAATAAFINSPL